MAHSTVEWEPGPGKRRKQKTNNRLDRQLQHKPASQTHMTHPSISDGLQHSTENHDVAQNVLKSSLTGLWDQLRQNPDEEYRHYVSAL